MPLGRLDTAYTVEFHVPDRPHMYGQPTIYKWRDLREGKYEGQRLQSEWKGKGNRSHYIAGGIHMTHLSYLPNIILKTITATEGHYHNPNNLQVTIANCLL